MQSLNGQRVRVSLVVIRIEVDVGGVGVLETALVHAALKDGGQVDLGERYAVAGGSILIVSISADKNVCS